MCTCQQFRFPTPPAKIYVILWFVFHISTLRTEYLGISSSTCPSKILASMICQELMLRGSSPRQAMQETTLGNIQQTYWTWQLKDHSLFHLTIPTLGIIWYNFTKLSPTEVIHTEGAQSTKRQKHVTWDNTSALAKLQGWYTVYILLSKYP